jgi:hypothetical protein
VVPAPSNRGMGTVLCAWAVVVLDAAVPRYACCGWGGSTLVHRPRDVREAYGAVVRGRAEDG